MANVGFGALKASMGPWVVTQGNKFFMSEKQKEPGSFNGALGCNPGKYGRKWNRADIVL